ncbi:MAG: NHLP family bacteriocin export ABC transporter peptidase/permease/ATPase subunit [Actinobacteria bacterium]|nr:NHLP family bacteriocin export ABC transporter peptidase/permease/ATPase subunit [Actinomycetota bacterium]
MVESSSVAVQDLLGNPVHKRVNTPTILQMEALECGAAALCIVMAHYGKWVPLEEVRTECGVSRDGSRASNIVKAANAYGMVAKGVRTDLRGLGELQLPAILFWNFNHFVVLEGFGRKGVYLNDPAIGPRRVTWEEFDGSYTGVAIRLAPSERFSKAGSPASLVAGLAKRFRGATTAITFCLLAGLGLLVPGLLVPAAVRVFVNQYLGLSNSSWLWPLVLGVLLAAVVQVVLTGLQQKVLLRLSVKLSVSMSSRFFSHVLRLPLTFFSQRYGGYVVTRTQANDQVANLLSSQLAASLLGLLTAILYLVLMFIYDWQLTLIAVGFATLNLVALWKMARRQRDANRRLVADAGKLTSTAVSGLQNIETIKATSEDSSFFSRWAGYQAKVMESMQSLGMPAALLSSMPSMLASLNMAVLLSYGGLQVMDRSLSLGTLVAFQVLVGGFNAPISQLVGFGSTMQQASGNLAGIDDVLNYPADPAIAAGEDTPGILNDQGASDGGVSGEPEGVGVVPENGESIVERAPGVAAAGAVPLPARLSGRLALEDITFGYAPLDPPLIDGFSLGILPGRRVAIVGPTGSGKSTVAQIVMGLYRPWRGRITIDGIQREYIPRRVLASTVGFVDQDIHLFEGTVRDNLTLWDPTASEESVVRAAKDACIHDDIVRRPGGYDYVMQEEGRDFSGGQRQRLEMARALVPDPAILVMDEATSALDPLVELEIDKRLRARGCTCLIVAHRLSTIRDADEIIVLKAGKVEERGTHDQLMGNNGLYSILVSG